MWSCRPWLIRMRFRMNCALGGICSFSASSTARTLAMACTVVHTPQKRWVNSQASRGSRPSTMFSMPRHMVQLAHALETLLPSTSTSMRRCPSIRVTGSMLIRVAISTHLYVGVEVPVIAFHAVPLLQRRRQNRQPLHGDQEQANAGADETQRDNNFNDRRRVIRDDPQTPRSIGQRGWVEAISHAADDDEETI